MVHTNPTRSRKYDSHPDHIPAKVIRAVKVSTFDICDYTVLYYRKREGDVK